MIEVLSEHNGTPFDMTVLNKISRFHLVMDALNNNHASLPGADELNTWCLTQLDRHTAYIREQMEDLPEIRSWQVGQSI